MILNPSQSLPTLTVLGNQSLGGAYLLRIRVQKPISVQFGRFQDGEAIPIPAGEYLYIGSALHRPGHTSLAHRLIRHATRTGSKLHHPICDHLFTHLPVIGLANKKLQPVKNKKLFWHIDYLLDQPQVDLTHMYIIRTTKPLEEKLAHWLQEDDHTTIILEGLGASDAPDETHLLAVDADAEWWRSLTITIQTLLDESEA